MLPKSLRIKIADFNRNPGRFKKIDIFPFTIFIKEGINTGTKFAIKVAKSVDKRSTARNRTKRLIEQEIILRRPNFQKRREVLINIKKLINDENKKEFVNGLKQMFENELN